ncbi:MAG: 1-(5-phosphoribosyl)-5-((5-phosphoribosylamino)methylideneamino)imidazole-4-carboxamide isomerase, partial [Elusimicrobia bacterium]|nr:1-(5-phosphoribosyl)-5-((5-phosphoribosylamino)methylideneamino)imidazole-4-carboxamide isomerase [Elusimicrobiota bacterium]
MLEQGKIEGETIYSDPMTALRAWYTAGAERL